MSISIKKPKIAKKPGTSTAKGRKTRSLKKFGRKRKFYKEDQPSSHSDTDDCISDLEEEVEEKSPPTKRAKESLKKVFRKMANLVKGNKKQLNDSYGGGDTSFNSESSDGKEQSTRGSSRKKGFKKGDNHSSSSDTGHREGNSDNKTNDGESDSSEMQSNDSKRNANASFNSGKSEGRVQSTRGSSAERSSSKEDKHSGPSEEEYKESHSDNETNEEESVSSDGLSKQRMRATSNKIEMVTYYKHRCITNDFNVFVKGSDNYMKALEVVDDSKKYKFLDTKQCHQYLNGMGVSKAQFKVAKTWVEKRYPRPSQLKTYDDAIWEKAQISLITQLCAKVYGKKFGMQYEDVKTTLENTYALLPPSTTEEETEEGED